MSKKNNKQIDVLIICGQGVYLDGKYYSEYPDHNVYLEHAITVKDVFEKFNYTHIVCSGGYTQQAQEISEAESFNNMWQDMGSKPDTENIIFDKYALDSAENIILGLIALRNRLKRDGISLTIRRIGAYSAWQFKKERFNNLAKELGILNQFYFHGFVDATKAQSGDLALKGEQNFLSNTKDDPFLVSNDAERKRRNRLKRGDYDNRFSELIDNFPQLFEKFDEFKRFRGIKEQIAFVNAFKVNIIDYKK